MPTLTITSKGQVTLRKEILAHLGVAPGDKVEVHIRPDGRLELAAAAKKYDISSIFGILKREGQSRRSIEEIDEAIAKGWAGER